MEQKKSLLNNMLEILENKLKDKSWTEQQDQEFIKVLEDLGKAVHNLGVRTYIMAESIDAFYQNMVELFDEDENSATSIPENGNVYPESDTNSSPVSPEWCAVRALGKRTSAILGRNYWRENYTITVKGANVMALKKPLPPKR